MTRTVTAGAISYTFRVSRVTNLAYQLDCLASLDPCSHDAFVADWSDAWTDNDKAAILEWAKLRRAYGGWVDSGAMQNIDPVLPIPARRRTIGVALRISAFGARDVDDWMARLRLLLSTGEVKRAETLVTPFVARADARWAKRHARLTSALDGYVEIVNRPEIRALSEKIATFYAIGDQGAVQTFELVARPRHASPTSAQQLGDLGVVEVVDGEDPSERWPVIAHEMFHAWFGASPIDRQVELAARFAQSEDPLAGPMFGLLDEALATVFGNGLVSRVVTPADYEKDLARPNGFYNDPQIDAYAKALLPAVEAQLAKGGTVYDAAFFPAMMAAAHEAFPSGLAPVAYLRPLGFVFHPTMREAGDLLADHSHASSIYNTDSLSEAKDVLRPAWGSAILWPRTHVRDLAPYITKAELALLQKQAAKERPFVYAKRNEKGAGVRFIFIADDNPGMSKLVDAFAALDASHTVATGILLNL